MRATLPELDRRLRSAGYRPGSPSAEVAAADAGVCARIACPRCSRAGLDYRPYVHPELGGAVGGYRPLAVCYACGCAEEF
jgi:hypothetical protein